MILVVGGTGDLGSAVTKRLLARGQAVRVMTRTPSKATELQQLGAEIVQGDLRDTGSLRRACTGANQVVASAHSVFGKGHEASKYVDLDGHKALIDAAKAAGVQQFVYMSTPDAAPDNGVPFLQFKYEIEQYLRGSGLSFVILRAASFMESHVHMLIGEPILAKGKVSLFGKGNNPRNFVAADDVARFVLIALEDPQAMGQIIQIGGPKNWTAMQVVNLYENVLGRKVKISHVPLGALKMMSVLIRPFHPGLSQIMKSSILFDTTDQTLDMSETLQKYPLTLTNLEEWIRDRISSERVSAGG